MPAAMVRKSKSVVLQVAREGAGPVTARIGQAVVEAIADGRLGVGDKLPPARTLARQLGVNPLTVTNAYRRLAAAGRVESRVGSGTYVCPHLDVPAAAAPAPEEIIFPMDRLKRIMDQIVSSEGAAAFGYDDPAGYPPLLETLCEYLRAGGIAAAPGRLAIFSGAQQGLSVIVQALLHRDDWVAVERPTYPGILRILQRAGVRVESVDLNAGGPDLRALERLFQTRPVRLFYSMPAYHNPTGICHRRDDMLRILELCGKYGVTLLEDDNLGDLDYGAGRPCRFQELAAPDADVLHLKSFSQLLLPGLRLGFCLAPERTAAILRQAKQEADLMTSGFFQRVLHLFLKHGYFAEHVRNLEHAERERFQALLAAAKTVLEPAGFRVLPPAGGPRLWVKVPDGAAPERVFAECARRGLPVRPGAEFSADGAATAAWFCFNGAGVPAAAFPARFRELVRAAR